MTDRAPSRALIVQLEEAAQALRDEFWDGGMWGNTIARGLYSRIQEDITLFIKMRTRK